MQVEKLEEATPDEIRGIQRKSYKILCYFQDFCNKHNLQFYLAGGTLIGAIRHQGFIPWDDDVDIFMLRQDYERLPFLWNKYADTERYSYCRTNEKENYHDTGASIRDNNTTFINYHSVNDDIHHGLQIDLLPIDTRPDGWIASKIQIFWAMLYSLFNAQRLPDRQGKILRGLSFVLLNLCRSKSLRYKIWSYAKQKMTQYEYDESAYCVELSSGLRSMLRVLPKEWFSHTTMVPFEDRMMPIMQGYDPYLRAVWGDYMQLPPVKDRVAKHNTVFIDLDNSYQKYKGIYYLTNNSLDQR